jgi:hypothetical protein
VEVTGCLDMAKTNYLIEGLSGTGKSSVYEELARRGYPAITTDRTWAYSADPITGLPGAPAHHDNFMWDMAKQLKPWKVPYPISCSYAVAAETGTISYLL